ncbi:MAG: cupin domain-containing protein [Eubacteriales bacterium]|nr:cupin domain-containing protein [Eubacteriales bacterium]
MLIRSSGMQKTQRERLRGGDGTIDFLHIVPAEELPSKLRVCAVIDLKKGCGIGEHTHQGDTEIYYVLEGEGVLCDNGAVRPFRKGDCNVCGSGGSHAVYNEKDETLKIFEVIVFE